MKELGIFLCCQTLLSVSIIITVSKLVRCIDGLQGDFYQTAYSYIDPVQWAAVIIPFLVGFVLVRSKK